MLKWIKRGEDGKPYVFTVTDDKARRIPIRVGEASGNRVLVLDGLSAGQRIVVSGAVDLEDGMAVSVKAEQE